MPALQQGMVYVATPRNLDTLANLASKRFNIVPIVQGSTSYEYRMFINMVDVLFAPLDCRQHVIPPPPIILLFCSNIILILCTSLKYY